MAKVTALYRTVLPAFRALVGVVLLSLGTAGHAALLTILDGEAVLISGDRAFAAAEGLQVADQTLVRTSATTRLLRLEWPDGSMLDLGPDTQAMLAPTAFGLRDKRPPTLYLLKGWAKQSSATQGATTPGQVAPRFDAQPFQGTVVSYVGVDETWLFVETGSLNLAERDGAGARIPLKGGEAYTRPSDATKGNVSLRPSPAQAQRVPRAFRDTLPHRAAAFKDRKVEPKALPPPSVAELLDWLKAEPALRKEFPRRFAARAQEGAFRAELMRRVGDHPEWVPVLYPERLKKP